MGWFGKKGTAPRPLPPGFTAADIETESSICTGETVIGFREKSSGQLRLAEAVRSEADVEAFYRAYGLQRP